MDVSAYCVVRGRTHQGDIRYQSAFNLSCVSNAVCFLACTLYDHDIAGNDPCDLIDGIILPAGFILFINSVNPPRFIEVEELNRSFSVGPHIYNISAIEIIVQGSFPVCASDYNNVSELFSTQLEPYLESQSCSQGFIFIGLGRSVAFVKVIGNFYVFDSHAVGPNGIYDFNNDGNNVSRIFRFTTFFSLAKFLLIHGRNGCKDFYSVTRVTIDQERNLERISSAVIVSNSTDDDVPISELRRKYQSTNFTTRKEKQCSNKQKLVLSDSSQDDVPLLKRRKKSNVIYKKKRRTNSTLSKNVIDKLGRPKNTEIKELVVSDSSQDDVPLLKRRKKSKVICRKKRRTTSANSKNVIRKPGRPKENIGGRPQKSTKLISKYRGDELKEVNFFSLRYTDLTDSRNFTCPKCTAKLYFEERNRKSWCCSGGNISHNLPDLNANFYNKNSFVRNARGFNNIFSFSALGVTHGFQHPRQGISFLKIQGRTYHRIFDLAYSKTHNPISLYVTDPSEREREAANRKLDSAITKEISDFLKLINPYINLFKQLSEMPSEQAHIIFENTTRRTHGNILGDMPQNKEIAFLFSTEREKFDRKTIAVWKIGAAEPHIIDIMHELYEPLQYPILYPHGTPGWRVGLFDNSNKKLSQVKYYRHLLLAVPRFSTLGHLSDEWICDMYCRTEEERLRFIQFSHGNARVATLNELSDETIAGENFSPGKVYLPNSFTAGPRYMRTKYMDAMAIVNRMGKPSFFLTMTCNPNWPEIREYKNNASVCARVFHEKMQQLIRDIKTGDWFGPIMYMFYCVEFQKRGLPHLHLAFKVANSPVQTHEIETFIRADIPSIDEAGGKLRPLVLKHMIHGPCGRGNRINLPCVDKDTKKCAKFFPKPDNPVCYIDNKGFVHLRRDERNAAVIGKFKTPVNDTWVVPYNAALLLRYDCHINLEVVASKNLTHYLYKYITKGPDFARVQVVTDADKNSEIEEYVTKRYLSAPECCWRLFSYNIVHREPNVIQLPVHLEGQHSIIFRPGNEDDAISKSSSALLIYLNRPSDSLFDDVRYLDFYENFIVHSKRPASTVTEVFRHPDGRHYLTRRQRGAMVARMFWVPPSRGELFYLRLLLNVVPARSFRALLSPGNEPCATYQSAARSIGLANDDDEYESALQEASTFMIGRCFRRFFVLLINNGAPSEKLWCQYRDLICSDLIVRVGDHEKAYKLGLLEIKRSLSRVGTSLREVGLPEVEDDSTELGRELIGFNVGELSNFINEWEPKLSVDQRAVFDYVRGVVSGTLFYDINALFLDGPAGTGKTLLLNVIAAFVRSVGKIAICTATSGIAAQNYPGGMTAHTMFRLPVILPDDGAYWGLSNGTERAQLLHASAVIIFDEAPMAHKNYLGLLDRSFRDLMKVDALFGGKLIIFAGDFRQIPPVVKGARGKNDYISASFKSSQIWNKIKIYKLKQTQRNRDDLNYSDFLLKMGNGSLSPIMVGTGRQAVQLIGIPDVPFCTTLDELINFTFPKNLIGSPDLCYKRAILSVLNININEINLQILHLLEGNIIHLYSSDFMDDTDAQAFLMGCDALNQVQAPGVPNHDLVLKVGALCMITRNLSFEEGLLNGTKVVIVQATTRIVTVRKPGESEHHAIPRILFKVDMDDKGMATFSRRQFPLQLAYAMTINKSQGQTLDCVGLDLRSDVFTHGQAYVAFGRVRTSENIKVLVENNRVIDGIPHVCNIVYSDLIG